MSVAVRVRVFFAHPRTGEQMLALERRATVLDEAGGWRVSVRA